MHADVILVAVNSLVTAGNVEGWCQLLPKNITSGSSVAKDHQGGRNAPVVWWSVMGVQPWWLLHTSSVVVVVSLAQNDRMGHWELLANVSCCYAFL